MKINVIELSKKCNRIEKKCRMEIGINFYPSVQTDSLNEPGLI